jgi:hypothetical protein
MAGHLSCLKVILFDDNYTALPFSIPLPREQTYLRTQTPSHDTSPLFSSGTRMLKRQRYTLNTLNTSPPASQTQYFNPETAALHTLPRILCIIIVPSCPTAKKAPPATHPPRSLRESCTLVVELW